MRPILEWMRPWGGVLYRSEYRELMLVLCKMPMDNLVKALAFNSVNNYGKKIK